MPAKRKAKTPLVDGNGADAQTSTALHLEPGQRALEPDVVSQVDGIPARYHGGWQWLLSGIRRHPRDVLLSLLFAWSGLQLAVWAAFAGAIAGMVLAAGVLGQHPFGADLPGIIGSKTVSPIALVLGLVLGFVGGFVGVLVWIIGFHFTQWLGGMIAGAILGALLLIVFTAYERTWLRLRGYRRLSRFEVREIALMVKEVADRMNLDGLPRFAIEDSQMPNAWTHARTIVLTTGLLRNLDDGEIRAILAHELHHWRTGDVVGLYLQTAVAWPLALALNIGHRLGEPKGRGSRNALLAFVGWFIGFPAQVITRFLIAPAVASTRRRYEYEADAAAAQLGYSAQLITAIQKIGAFESGRSGWENTLAATHPPVELRVEALQPPLPDDAVFQEDELRGPSLRQVWPLLRNFWLRWT
jgi:Zn-dependent protease with chaperone function